MSGNRFSSDEINPISGIPFSTEEQIHKDIAGDILEGRPFEFFEEMFINALYGPFLHRIINDPIPESSKTFMMIVAFREDDDDVTLEVAEFLQQHGADLNVQTEAGETPLYFAAMRDKPRLLKWMIANGADITLRNDVTMDRSQVLPHIHMACQSNHLECFAALCQAAVEQDSTETLNVRCHSNQTCAQIALQRGNIELIGMLAKAGADLRQGFSLRFRPMEMAAHDKHHASDSTSEPLPEIQPHFSLQQAMVSFNTMECAHCKAISHQNVCCSRCHMAYYCNGTCQKRDWAMHKLVCKRLRKGQDMVELETAENGQLPAPNPEQFGFTREYAGKDFIREKQMIDEIEEHRTAVWEYNAGTRGHADWQRFPAYIEGAIEYYVHMGTYMSTTERLLYTPGVPEAEGQYCPQVEMCLPENYPRGLAKNYVHLFDMMEREVDTGAIRAVRRNGSRTPIRAIEHDYVNNPRPSAEEQADDVDTVIRKMFEIMNNPT
jgi:hypothetical protein